jgi:enoyl-CoA hydratase/carnithine racemase
MTAITGTKTAQPQSSGQPRTPAQAAAQPLVLTAVDGAVGLLTLNHPEKRNALSRAMIGALRAALERFRADRAIKAIVIAANGPVFSAGHDLKEFVGAEPAAVDELLNECTALMDGLRLLPQAVIAQVHGLASAAGCQLVASCDLAVASSEARFQTPGVKIGLFCSTPMIPLSRAIAPKKALEMLFTGRAIGAEEAERAGLVNRVVAPEALAAETLALAKDIAGYSGDILALGKPAFYRQLALELPQAYAVGKEAMARNVPLPDAQEGMSAFLQKRAPKWSS